MNRVNLVSEVSYNANRAYVKTKLILKGKRMLILVMKNRKCLYSFSLPIIPSLKLEDIFREINILSAGKIMQWSLGDTLFMDFMNKMDFIRIFYNANRNFGIELHEPLVILERGSKECERLMALAHEKEGIHLGARKTVEEIMKRHYWSKISRDVRDFVKNCDSCNRQGNLFRMFEGVYECFGNTENE